MAATIIDKLAIASWTGNNNTNFVDGNATKPMEATLAIQADEIDDTALAAAIKSRTSIPGLYQWTVSFVTRLQPSYIAGSAGVTYSNGYVTSARAWSMALQWAVQDATVFGDGVAARSFLPGLMTAGGTYEVIQDTSTNLSLPPTTAGSATFKVDTNTGGTAHSLAGSIYASQLSAPMRVGELAVATYTYRVSGDVTAAGDYASGSGARDYSPFGYWIENTSGVVGTPVAGTFTLNDTTGGTIAGSAFPSSVTYNVRVGELVTLNVVAQGTGALTLT